MSTTEIGRRHALGKIGFAGVALLASSRCGDGTTTAPTESGSTTTTTVSPTAACVLTPAMTEGPFYCDASGLYSGYGSEGTAGERFLRGIQVTDANGRVEFDTLYPGFYRGRTIHVHFKIHLDERTAVTSQLYFPESVNDAVMATSPYNASGTRDTRNSNDSIFSSATILDVTSGGGSYAASLVIGVST